MNKILLGHKYVGNFIDAPVRLGMIFRMDAQQFIPAMHFNDAYPAINLGKWTEAGSKGNIRFSESTSVSFAFGASATTGIGESEIGIKFKKSKSVAGYVQDAAVERFGYSNILPQLKKLWNAQGYSQYYKEYVLVFEVVTAASGTLIYSEDRNNEVVLRHKLGAAVKKIADLGSGNFEFVSNSKRTLEIIRAVAHKPLFKAFRLRKDWRPEILGT
jgi:hypothetical protein